jgi:hypothetical protein
VDGRSRPGEGDAVKRATALRPLAFAAVAGMATVAYAGGCGGGAPTKARTAQARDAEPRWEDIFDTTPELLAIVSPASLRSDKVYGPLLGRVIQLAREQSPVVAETRALDAMEDAEQIVIGMRPDAPERAGEVVIVIRGVRANVDPIGLVDAEGHALWGPGPPGAVRELVRAATSGSSEPPMPASLFELAGRTWVIASGDARERARAAFAHPLGRPPMRFEGGALAVVRLDGPSVVARVRALQASGTFAAVGEKLEALTFELLPGTDKQVRATLSYTNEDGAAFSEASVREVLEAIARRKPDRFAWLSAAKLERPGKRVVVTAPLPPGLVDALMRAAHAGRAAGQDAGALEQAPTAQ